MSQNERVLERLQQGLLTSLEAIQELGITRLSARVHDLTHKHGHVILSEDVLVQNRFGDQCLVAKYTLIPDRRKAS